MRMRGRSMRHQMPVCEMLRSITLFSCALLLMIGAGCGGEAKPPVAQVKGKVTFNGAPVKGGTITFSPYGGSGYTGTGAVKDDGTFVLSAADAGEGAPIG